MSVSSELRARDIEPYLNKSAFEVENAFQAACDANAIRGTELRAQLSQSVCMWPRLERDARAKVLPHFVNFFE
jgi:hypothetical protein